jgi:hypothetical protein
LDHLLLGLLETPGHLLVRGPGGVRLAPGGAGLGARGGHHAPRGGDLLLRGRKGRRGGLQAPGGVAGHHGGVLEDRLHPFGPLARTLGVVARVGGGRGGSGQHDGGRGQHGQQNGYPAMSAVAPHTGTVLRLTALIA